MKKEITLKVKPGQWGELAKVAEDIRAQEKTLWSGGKMGEYAMALSLNGYADRIEIALGIQPRPKTYYTPPAALDVIAGDRPLDAVMMNPPFAGLNPQTKTTKKEDNMPTKLSAFLIALHSHELNIIEGDFWEDDDQILAVAIAYQLYTQLEQRNYTLGRIADALEKLARKEAK